jgi:O-acetyl-ADP-ribose deacetylase (regulator of RNase III)
MADELFLGDTVIELTTGDITAWKGDAIVNAANTTLAMGAGVAGAIARRGGVTIQREALEKAPVALGEVARTRGGLLPAKFVIHAAVLGPSQPAAAAVVARATAAALADAEAIGLKSIAFPALGTGVGQLPYADAAAAMLEATVKYLAARPVARLRKITFVLYDDPAYRAFQTALEKYRDRV